MTRRTKRGLRFGALAVVASAASQWVGAQNERLTVDVGQCVDLPTPEQRLACFEAQVEAARAPASAAPSAPAADRPAPAPAPAPPASAAAPAASSAPAAAAVAPAAPSEPPAGFGFRERQRDEPEAAAPPEVRAKIVELRETVPNAFLITLDNGQVWRQTRPNPYVAMRVGYDVNISFARRFRAYRLSSPDMAGFVQVERVR